MEGLGLVEASPDANPRENCRVEAHIEPVHCGVAGPQHSRLDDKVKKATGMSSGPMRMENLRGSVREVVVGVRRPDRDRSIPASECRPRCDDAACSWHSSEATALWGRETVVAAAAAAAVVVVVADEPAAAVGVVVAAAAAAAAAVVVAVAVQ